MDLDLHSLQYKFILDNNRRISIYILAHNLQVMCDIRRKIIQLLHSKGAIVQIDFTPNLMRSGEGKMCAFPMRLKFCTHRCESFHIFSNMVTGWKICISFTSCYHFYVVFERNKCILGAQKYLFDSQLFNAHLLVVFFFASYLINFIFHFIDLLKFNKYFYFNYQFCHCKHNIIYHWICDMPIVFMSL